jgi:hypothetical protein
VVTAAELVRLHPDLRVVRLRAANTKLGAPKPVPLFVGPYLSGDAFPKQSLRPVATVVLEPGSDDTYLIAGVTASKPGTYHLDGWRMHYRTGGIAGVTTYQQRLEIRVS